MSHTMQPNVLPPAFDDLTPAERQGAEVRALAGDKGHRAPSEFSQRICCVQCESPIAKEMVIGRMLPMDGLRSTQRRFTAHCAHCELLQEIDAELRDDAMYHAITAPRIVRDAERRKAFFGAVRSRLSPTRQRES